MIDENEFINQLECLFSGLEDPLMDQKGVSASLKAPIRNIIERKRAEKQLTTFRALVENAVDAIFVSDPDGNQTYINRACYDIFGYDYERQEMNDLPLISLWPEEDVPILTGQVLPQARAGSWSGEVRQKRKDGASFDAHLTAFPVLDLAGQPISIAIIIRDIYERKQLERKHEKIHERHALQMQLVTGLAQEIAAAPTLDELYRCTVTLLKERLGYHQAQIFRYDPELENLVVVEDYAQDEADKLPRAGGVVAAAAATGQPILIPDVTQHLNWTPHPDSPNVKSELAVPIKLRNRVLGVLDVLSDTAGALTREDEIVLVDLAGRIASAIENICLLEEANALLQFTQAPEGIGWITLEDNTIIYANPTLCSILGEAKPEDALGKSIMTYYPGDLQARVRNEILPAVVREGRWVGELALRSAQGKVTPTIQNLFLIHDEKGKPVYWANVVTDITQQQAAFHLDKLTKRMWYPHHIGRRIEKKPQSPRFLAWVTERIPLQRTWRRVITGLFALGALIVLGTLLMRTIKSQVQAKNPVLAAMLPASPSAPSAGATVAQPSPSPISAVATVAQLSPSPLPPTIAPTTFPTAMPSPTWTPAAPTFTPSPVPLIVPSPFPRPGPDGFVPSTTLPIPSPVPPVPVAADAINIVVLGSDQRPDWSEWHTDVVQVVSIQRDGGSVSVISIPRDLYLYIPDFNMSRINFADFYGEEYEYEGGGPALVRDTLLYNLGIQVDHYVRTNFDGLIAIVDTVGGVDIPVHCRLSDHWPYPDENGEYPILTMEPGVHHMDGETALWYARSRKTTSVFSRERRQQQVLQALWRKGRDAGMLARIPALWNQARDMVVTDMTLTDVLALAQVALTLKDQNVRFYNIGADVVTPWRTPYGGGVFLPNWEKIQPLVAEAMAPIPEARLSRTYMPVEVWNGTSNPDWGWLAADRLYRAGLPAAVGEPDRQDYAETRLIIFSEIVKGSGAGYLQQAFGLSDDQVTHQPGGSSEFGFRLILGADYQTCPGYGVGSTE